jgi:hypothetical protein
MFKRGGMGVADKEAQLAKQRHYFPLKVLSSSLSHFPCWQYHMVSIVCAFSFCRQGNDLGELHSSVSATVFDV